MHDTYLEEIDHEHVQGELVYLDKPGDDHSTVLVRYAAYLKGRDEAQVQSNARPCQDLLILRLMCSVGRLSTWRTC